MKEKIELNSDALSLRKRFNEDAYSPIDIFSLVASTMEITLVYFPFSEEMSGICIKDENVKVIAMNSKMSNGRQRFTIAHELYHLYFQEKLGKFVCHKDINGAKETAEREADQFASYFLAPHDSLRKFIHETLGKNKGQLDVNDVVQIEQYFQMSRGAILWRLVDEGYLTPLESETMKTGIQSSANRLGYSLDLYQPTIESRQHFTLGKYVSLADKLNQSGKISQGKYDELLLEAFRSDLVYGDDLDLVDAYD